MLGIDRAQPGQRAGVRVARVARRASAAERARERHDEVAAGDQRLLVSRRNDLARAQRREDRPEADDTAGRDDDDVDVVARRQRLERVAAPDAFRAGRQLQAR